MTVVDRVKRLRLLEDLRKAAADESLPPALRGLCFTAAEELVFEPPTAAYDAYEQTKRNNSRLW